MLDAKFYFKNNGWKLIDDVKEEDIKSINPTMLKVGQVCKSVCKTKEGTLVSWTNEKGIKLSTWITTTK